MRGREREGERGSENWGVSTDLDLSSVFGVVGDCLVSPLALVGPETLQLFLVLGQLVGQDVDIVPHLGSEIT